jgi:peptide/nickel transport system permease protein
MTETDQSTTDQTTGGGSRPLPGAAAAETARRVFAESRLALLGLVITVGVVIVAAFAPVIAPYDPTAQNIAEAQLLAPSLEHPMGTDQLGRDVLSRVLYGAQLSIQVGVIAVGVAMLAGVPLGLVAGFYGGYTDETVMRAMDVVFSFPAILLAIAMVAILGQSTFNVMLAIGITYTPIFARVTRSGVLSVREETFVDAARAIGDSNASILARDILPNVVAPIIVQATVSLAFAILAESALSFLGLGAPPPAPSWGRMLSDSRNFMESAPWTALFPGLAIMVTILGFNFLGDGLRDTLDPQNDTESGGSI